jgi:putative ubiquitin-RnfH superfamily antitoxin RatB of RatAB toxin-antitoxin module
MPEADCQLVEATVVYALPERSHLFQIRVPRGTTVGSAIQACGILRAAPELAGRDLDVGIFGRCCALGEPVQAGDRIEIYRPLKVDPKTARRERAATKAP